MVLPDVSPAAALIGDATRAAILTSLLDGRARAAGELAVFAQVSAQTASNHLAKLLAGGLLELEVQGRHRYYRLAGREVAQALEALAALVPSTNVQAPDRPPVPEGLRFARSCYDHLAGTLGVAITEALVARDWLIEDRTGYRTTPAGSRWFTGQGVDLAELRSVRRAFARRCLDWSERRPHLGGALGAALLARLLKRDWIARVPSSRALRLTLSGRRALEDELRLRIPAVLGAAAASSARR